MNIIDQRHYRTCVSVAAFALCLMGIPSVANGINASYGQIQVEPGKGIAGIMLGMTEAQVISKLGSPNNTLTKDEMYSKGGTYRISSGGKSEKVPYQEEQNTKVLEYSDPHLSIVFGPNYRVAYINLYYVDNVVVGGYGFIKFVYLTRSALEKIGEPSSTDRMIDSEQKMMADGGWKRQLEYYEYYYNNLGLNLGLVFDRTKQKTSNYYIGVNHISVFLVK